MIKQIHIKNYIITNWENKTFDQTKALSKGIYVWIGLTLKNTLYLMLVPDASPSRRIALFVPPGKNRITLWMILYCITFPRCKIKFGWLIWYCETFPRFKKEHERFVLYCVTFPPFKTKCEWVVLHYVLFPRVSLRKSERHSVYCVTFPRC